MANRTWQELAAKAKEIAKKIISGEETNSKGERLLHIVYRFDIFASDSLNQKFADSGSIASIHTYQGGNQVITTKHSDGSKGTFNSNGEINATDAPMDMEVNDYINKNLNESNMKTNKRNVVRLTESQLKQMIAESVKNVLNEEYYGNEYSTDSDALKNLYAIRDNAQHALDALDKCTYNKHGRLDKNAFFDAMAWCESLYHDCMPFCKYIEHYMKVKASGYYDDYKWATPDED